MHYSSTAEELSTLKRTLEQLPIKTVLIALAMLVISILIVKLVLAIVDKALKKTKLDVSQYRFIKALLRVLLYFCALMIIASYLGIDVTSLVALISVVSLAISLSVQNVLSNVAGGMMVIGAKPFKQGDYVSVDGLEGTVDEIGLVYTKLHTIDNRRALIPNSKTCSATIENFSALGKRRLELEVSASYDSDLELVREALRKAVDRCQPMEGEEIAVEFHSFDDSAIAYHVHFWIPSSRFVATRFALRRYVWEEFKSHGVQMTYPHLNVHLEEQH